MKYHFRVGRGKNIVISENETFLSLGYAILNEYKIIPDHLFMFKFNNGETTNSATPFGAYDDYGDVSIEAKLKTRKMQIGETMTMIYDYCSDWSRKVKLVDIIP